MEKLLSLDLQEILIRLLLALLALVVIWALRRVILRLVLPLMRRLVRRSGTDVDDVVLNAITAPVHLLVLALALYVAAAILLPEGIPDFIVHLTRTLVILAVFAALHKTVGLITRSAVTLASLTGLKLDEQLLPFIRTATQVILIALALVIVLQEWQYDVGGLITGLGLGGLAFALAAQDTAANLFGFTTIVSDRPFTVGEYIVTPDVSGTVEHVGFRSTRIRQLDQAIVTIPNSTLANSVITNWSRLTKRRLDLTIGVTYDTGSGQMRELLTRIKAMLEARDAVIADSITVLFSKLGDSALEVLVRAYIALPDWGDFMAEQEAILLAIMDVVEELGLSFAFPSQSVYIEQMPHPAEDSKNAGE